MNHFERVAIFTLVENIENQLKGLKTLIAASANQGTSSASHKVTPTLEMDSHELSDDDEDRVERAISEAREEEVQKMRKSAEATFQTEWDATAQGMAKLNG